MDDHIISGEYIVKLKDLEGENSKKTMFDTGAKVGGKLEKIKALKIEVSERIKESFLQKIRKDKNVDWIEPNYLIEIESTPDDPLWSQQWSPRKIGADTAWDIIQGSRDVLVVVIDTGIYYTHPDLAANYVAGGYDWVNKDNDPIDDNGHGTHCAGIIAATTNNGEGIAGLAQVRIMAEKFLSSKGSGSTWDAAQAIMHAVDVAKTISNRTILSNSWGGSSDSSAIHDAINYAYQNGVMIVAAAGNSHSSTPFYPAAYPEVISVSATDSNDQPASFSNYGSTIELAAPGVSIYSTYLNGAYTFMTGTSMACPHVAGLAALVWSRFPAYSRDLVRTILRNTADDLGEVGWDQCYGWGRVNAYKAVQGCQLHDLELAGVAIPPLIFAADLVKINATVQNIGANTESNVTVQLLINNALTSIKSILAISIGERVNLELDWTPASIGSYNITVHVLPVNEESALSNNRIISSASVQEMRHILAVADDDANCFASKGTSLNEITSALTKQGYVFSTWTESEYGRPGLDMLLKFRLLIWTCGDYWNYAVDSADADTLRQYVNNGGSILLEGEDIGLNHFNDGFMNDVAHAISQVDTVGSNGLSPIDSSHLVCEGLPSSISWMTHPPSEDGVTPTTDGKEVIGYTGTSYSAVVTSGNGGSGSTVYISFPLSCLEETIREKVIVNSIRWLQSSCVVKLEPKNPEIVGLKTYVDRMTFRLPTNVTLPAGSYDFAVWPRLNDNLSAYVFDHWEDESGQTISRSIYLTSNIQSNRTFYVSFRKCAPCYLNLSVSKNGNLTRGQEFDLTVTYANVGSSPISDVIVKLIHSLNVQTRTGELENFSITSISPGASGTLTWHITCGDPGIVRLIITANGRDESLCPVTCVVRLSDYVAQ
jgi:thermitase